MKKLLLIFAVLCLTSCTQDYKDINYTEMPPGTTIQIDSTEWTPVLMQVDGNELRLYESGKIKEISIIDGGGTALAILCLSLMCIILFIGLIVEER